MSPWHLSTVVSNAFNQKIIHRNWVVNVALLCFSSFRSSNSLIYRMLMKKNVISFRLHFSQGIQTCFPQNCHGWHILIPHAHLQNGDLLLTVKSFKCISHSSYHVVIFMYYNYAKYHVLLYSQYFRHRKLFAIILTGNINDNLLYWGFNLKMWYK